MMQCIKESKQASWPFGPIAKGSSTLACAHFAVAKAHHHIGNAHDKISNSMVSSSWIAGGALVLSSLIAGGAIVASRFIGRS